MTNYFFDYLMLHFYNAKTQKSSNIITLSIRKIFVKLKSSPIVETPYSLDPCRICKSKLNHTWTDDGSGQPAGHGICNASLPTARFHSSIHAKCPP